MIRVSQEMGMWPTLLLDAPCDGDGGVNPDRHSRSHVLHSELTAPARRGQGPPSAPRSHVPARTQVRGSGRSVDVEELAPSQQG